MIPIKIPAGLLVYRKKQILKFILKRKGTRNPKLFCKRNRVGGIMHLDFKTYRVIVTCDIGERM